MNWFLSSLNWASGRLLRWLYSVTLSARVSSVSVFLRACRCCSSAFHFKLQWALSCWRIFSAVCLVAGVLLSVRTIAGEWVYREAMRTQGNPDITVMLLLTARDIFPESHSLRHAPVRYAAQVPDATSALVAVRAIRQALVDDPNAPDLLWNMGVILSGRGELEAGKRLRDKAARESPLTPAFCGSGKCLQ